MQGFQILLTPFVWVLMFFYNIFGNYGMALIFFALLVKIILFPLSLKGKRSMIQMNMLQGRMNQIQKQCGTDKERYNLEVQKLYEKEKVNPMGGCLWTLLPVLVIFPLYAIIRQPLTYVMNLTPEQITTLLGALPQTINQAGDAYYQLTAAEVLTQNFQAVVSNPAVAGFAQQLQAVNFNMLGLNLASVPQPMFWQNGLTWGSIGLFLLPVISAGAGLIFSRISMKTNSINKQTAQAANNPTSKMMMIISPLMSLWIGFIMPAGLSIYWIANNIFSMVQEIICSKMLKKDYEKAAAEAERREAEEKEEEKRRKEEARLERARRIEEAKQNKGKKKPAPKKKDDEGIPAGVKEASRVGLRAYARGRAYDPFRYSSDGPTVYQEKIAAVDDEAVEKALEKKAREKEKAEFAAKYNLTEEELKEVETAALAEAGAPAMEGGAKETEAGDEAEKPIFETPKYDAPDYDGVAKEEEDDTEEI